MSSTRARQEQFIREHDDRGSFDDALAAVIRRHGGLSFFTDEQVAEITAQMAHKERWQNSFRIVERSHAIALRARS